MLESVIGYATPDLNVQASSTIKAACGTAAFRTRDDPKHDAGHSSAFSFPPALCSSRKENRDVGTTEDHFVCRAGDRCRWLLRPAVAQAQESKITWRISQPGGNSTQYKTQQQAVQAIKSLPAPSPFPPEFQFGWQSVDKIKSKVVDLNGNTSITYWMGKSQPSDPDWSYIGRDIFPTEEAMVADLLADQQASNPVCPGRRSLLLATGLQLRPIRKVSSSRATTI